MTGPAHHTAEATSPVSEPLVLQDLFGRFSPVDHGTFVTLWPGVEILPLYGLTEAGEPLDPAGPSAAILRYSPGASVPVHAHPGHEHILVLSGSQRDGRATYPAGTCVINPPGTRHSVTSDDGCLVLAIWTKPVEVIDG